jgi:hypothetical protein
MLLMYAPQLPFSPAGADTLLPRAKTIDAPRKPVVALNMLHRVPK